jgi:hypothetical protein
VLKSYERHLFPLSGDIMAEAMTPASGMGGVGFSNDAVSFSDEAFSATTALVAFLRMETDLAEQKAKRLLLREQASALAQQFGAVTDTSQQHGAFSLN